MIQGETYTVHIGSNLDILPTLPDNSVDSIVTDPPYGLSDNKFVAETITRWINGERDSIPDGKGFMGKSWDAFVPPPAVWDECLRVLKPGGHLLAFFGSRTQDIGALSIRLAGFEIRDSIAWMYGSGFPKSLDISKAIDKKRDDSKEADSVAKWLQSKLPKNVSWVEIDKLLGTTGAKQKFFTPSTSVFKARICSWEQWLKIKKFLNFDDSMDSEVWRLNGRKGQPGDAWSQREVIGQKPSSLGGTVAAGERNQEIIDYHKNKIVDITAPATPEAQQWEGWGTALKPAFEPIVVARKPLIGTVAENVLTYGTGGLNIAATRVNDRWPSNVAMSDDMAHNLEQSVYFFVPKATKRDRSEGLEGENFHPTVKPTDLMRNLVKLVTPPGGTVLDPFTGSGSTGKAAILEGFDFIGIELTDEYLPIIEGRLAHAEKTKNEEPEGLF